MYCSSLHVQPCRVVNIQPLVGPRSPPLDLDVHAVVQAQGSVAVVESSLRIIHPQETLCTITEWREIQGGRVEPSLQAHLK